jgi:phage/plasmid-like protein (TIGR03299 family)
MAFFGATPWHGLGAVIPSERNQDLRYCRQAAGMASLTYSHRDLFLADGRKASTRAVVRDDTGAVMGEVGPGHELVQLDSSAALVAPFLREGMTVESLGLLRGGSRAWYLLRTHKVESLPGGDDVALFLLFSDAFDGSKTANIGTTNVRVVCANTLATAERDKGASKLLKVRHTRNVLAGLALARDAMDTATMRFEATADEWRAMARKGVTTKTLKTYVNQVFAPQRVKATQAKASTGLSIYRAVPVVDAEWEDDIASDVAELRSNVFPRIERLFEEGAGAQLSAARGTVWGAYNAVTAYLTHERGKDAERRLDEGWFGSGATLNRLAFARAVELAHAA